MPGSPSGACAAPAYPAVSVRRAMPPPCARCGGCRPLHPPPLLALCTPVVAAHNRRPSPMHLASTRAHRHGDHISAPPRTAAPLLHLCTSAPVRLRASAGLPERDRCAWCPRRRGDGHRGAHGDGAGAAGGRSISGRSITDCRGARTGGDCHSGAAHVQSVMCVMWYARGPRVLGEQAAARRRRLERDLPRPPRRVYEKRGHMARAQCQWLQSGHQAVLKPASALARPRRARGVKPHRR